MTRVLRVALGLLVIGAACFALGVFGVLHGWHLERRSADELSALLRPHDVLLRPAGPGPFPAALLFSGCAGPNQHVLDWARRLRELGFAALVVDSLAARGLAADDVCSGRSLWGRERAADVWVSLRDVRALPFVDPGRVVLVGWSHGAWSAMEMLALQAAGEEPAGLAEAPGSLDGVAGVVLFYPYCGFITRTPSSPWRLAAPVLMLLAADDELTPAGPCREVAADLAAHGLAVEAHLYEGVGHGFDGSDGAATRDARRRAEALFASVASRQATGRERRE